MKSKSVEMEQLETGQMQTAILAELKTFLASMTDVVVRRQRMMKINSVLLTVFAIGALLVSGVYIYAQYTLHQMAQGEQRARLYSHLLNDYNNYDVCMSNTTGVVTLPDQCVGYSLAFSERVGLATHYFQVNPEMAQQIVLIKQEVDASLNGKQANISVPAKTVLALLGKQVKS